MLNQILSHTPLYVWAILAMLVWRGLIASRDRELPVRKLFIIPLIMLALSLQDIASKFGLDTLTLGTWMLGAAVAALLVWTFGGKHIAAGATPGQVRVKGSWAPLLMMMVVFFSKYAASVAVAVSPQLHHNALFAAALCTLFGVFSGYFVGRLARDVAASLGLQVKGGGKVAAAA